MAFTMFLFAEANPFTKLTDCDVYVLSSVSEDFNGETEGD